MPSRANDEPSRQYYSSAEVEGAVCFYGAAILPWLRAMPQEDRQGLLQRAKRLSLTVPLDLVPGPYRFPEWPEALCGLEVITIMVLGLFVEQGERPELCEPLLEKWPIAEILFLVDGPPSSPPAA